MYIDVQSMSHEEKAKLKRQLRMEEMSYDSDFKKLERKEAELTDQLNRFKRERSRIEVQIEENVDDGKKIAEKKEFITEELRNIKKKLIELG
jgi:coenzyme F420-reducing hydrogenase delta subunit